MQNYEYIISQLGDLVLSYKWSSNDLVPNQKINFIDDQTLLNNTTLYIVSAEKFDSVLSSVSIEPGTIIFIGDVTKSGTYTKNNSLSVYSIIECARSCGTIYNMLSSSLGQLKDDFLTKQNNMLDTDTQHHLRHLWKLLRNRTLINKREIYEAFANVGPYAKRFYRICVVHCDMPGATFPEMEIIEKMQFIIPNAYIFNNPSKPEFEIIIIHFFDEQPFEQVEHAKELQSLLSNYLLHMMIANSTRDYSRMYTLYTLISRANYLSYMLFKNKDTRINFYKDFSMYMILDLCSEKYQSIFGHDDILYLGHPVAVHLFRYDLKHGTNLLDVLYYYLINNQDIKKTSRDLYMHRNTVTNKLNLIKNICPVDFEDGTHNQLMLFTCQLIQYYEKVMQRNLKNNKTTIEDDDNESAINDYK